MRRDREIFVLKKFVGIMSDCRRQLVADVLNKNPDLYNYLYADNENVRSLYKKLYELKWLERHWQKCRDLIDKTDFELATRREMLKIFLQHYLNFVAAWDYKPTDALFFKAQIESLDKMIYTHDKKLPTMNYISCYENEFSRCQLWCSLGGCFCEHKKNLTISCAANIIISAKKYRPARNRTIRSI